MGRKLVKKQKVTFDIYNERVDYYISRGMTEEKAIDKACSYFIDSVQFELDENDEFCRTIMTGGVPLMMLKEELGGNADDD